MLTMISVVRDVVTSEAAIVQCLVATKITVAMPAELILGTLSGYPGTAVMSSVLIHSLTNEVEPSDHRSYYCLPVCTVMILRGCVGYR